MQIIRDFHCTNCLFNPLTLTSSKWKKKKQNKQKFQVSFCKIQRNGFNVFNGFSQCLQQVKEKSQQFSQRLQHFSKRFQRVPNGYPTASAI